MICTTTHPRTFGSNPSAYPFTLLPGLEAPRSARLGCQPSALDIIFCERLWLVPVTGTVTVLNQLAVFMRMSPVPRMWIYSAALTAPSRLLAVRLICTRGHMCVPACRNNLFGAVVCATLGANPAGSDDQRKHELGQVSALCCDGRTGPPRSDQLPIRQRLIACTLARSQTSMLPAHTHITFNRIHAPTSALPCHFWRTFIFQVACSDDKLAVNATTAPHRIAPHRTTSHRTISHPACMQTTRIRLTGAGL